MTDASTIVHPLSEVSSLPQDQQCPNSNTADATPEQQKTAAVQLIRRLSLSEGSPAVVSPSAVSTASNNDDDDAEEDMSVNVDEGSNVESFNPTPIVMSRGNSNMEDSFEDLVKHKSHENDTYQQPISTNDSHDDCDATGDDDDVNHTNHRSSSSFCSEFCPVDPLSPPKIGQPLRVHTTHENQKHHFMATNKIVLKANHYIAKDKNNSNNSSHYHKNNSGNSLHSQHSSNHSGNSDMDNSHGDNHTKKGGGLLAPIGAAWGWIQKQNEKRKEQHLQRLAEEQLRQLQEAQQNNDPTMSQFTVAPVVGTSPMDNTSSNNTNNEEYISNYEYAQEEQYMTPTRRTRSKDEQSSSHRDDDDEEGEDDISWIPPVRCVEENPRRNSSSSPRSNNGGIAVPSPDGSLTLSPTSSSSLSDPTKPIPFILSPEQMHDIARYVLPKTIAFCRWKRLYSLTRDGDSFFQCLRLCGSEPKTLMVIKTTREQVLGGYADAPWEVPSHANGTFHGSAQACLFSFSIPPPYDDATDGIQRVPSKPQPSTNLKVFHWTGANRYIQFTDTSEQRRMLAFGGGGQEGAFGLCVEQDFQLGSTGPCDTFDNQPLCDPEHFHILDLEIWGFMTGQF